MERVEPRSPQRLFLVALAFSIALHVVISVRLPTWRPSASAPEPLDALSLLRAARARERA